MPIPKPTEIILLQWLLDGARGSVRAAQRRPHHRERGYIIQREMKTWRWHRHMLEVPQKAESGGEGPKFSPPPILPSSAHASHWMNLKRKEGRLERKSLILQCTTKKVPTQPMGNPQAKAVRGVSHLTRMPTMLGHLPGVAQRKHNLRSNILVNQRNSS